MKILEDAAVTYPQYIKNLRGAGTFIAFDSESPALRDKFRASLLNKGVLAGVNGSQSIRFRPALNFDMHQVAEFEGVLKATLASC